MLKRLIVILTSLVLVASACGSDATTTTTAAPATTAATTAAPAATAAPATTAAPEPVAVIEYGGTLLVGSTGDPESLNPFTSSAGAATEGNLYESLVRHDFTTYEIIPALAESWEQSADGLTWTFQLREDVEFHDGRSFTADDAVYSLGIAQQETSASLEPALRAVIGVEALDDYTVQITLSVPTQTLLSTLVFAYMVPNDPSIDFDDGGIGTGPFKFVSWDRNQSIVLERNENYWRSDADGYQLPYLDGIVIRPIADGGVAALELADGGVQLLVSADFNQYDKIQADGNVLAVLPPGVSGPYYDLRINTRKERLDGSTNPLGDVRVRQALSLAMDRPGVSEALFGLMPIFDNTIGPDSPFFNPDAPSFAVRDVERAKALLTEAGYPDGVDIGSLLIHANLGLAYEIIPVLLQQHWAEAGITVALESMDVGSWVVRVATDQDFDLANSGGSPKPDAFDLIEHPWAKSQELRTGWGLSSPEGAAFYELLAEARTLADPEEYRQALMDLQAMAVEGAHNIIIGGGINNAAHLPEVMGFVQHARALTYLAEVWLDQ